ncbi:zinc-binding dehydrogenase [Pararhizobium sp. PWRC1-1]|uniref:zinc-binding dehydrogenase n=1 Tax=Pararhizobium sp. PWRC1-1 TaxID=2804566 RepID=UPI003CFB369D
MISPSRIRLLAARTFLRTVGERPQSRRAIGVPIQADSRRRLVDVLRTREDRIERSSKLFSLIGSGKLSVEIAAVFPLSEGASAHRLLQERSAIGKILLCVAES